MVLEDMISENTTGKFLVFEWVLLLSIFWLLVLLVGVVLVDVAIVLWLLLVLMFMFSAMINLEASFWGCFKEFTLHFGLTVAKYM